MIEWESKIGLVCLRRSSPTILLQQLCPSAMRLSRAFLLLVCLQAAHSAEEFSFGLYQLLPYFRPFGDAAAEAFLIGNALVIGFGFWCYFLRVKPRVASASAWATGWALVEIANGILHLTWSLMAEQYIPGTVTAPLLLTAGIYLIWRIASRPASVTP